MFKRWQSCVTFASALLSTVSVVFAKDVEDLFFTQGTVSARALSAEIETLIENHATLRKLHSSNKDIVKLIDGLVAEHKKVYGRSWVPPFFSVKELEVGKVGRLVRYGGDDAGIPLPVILKDDPVAEVQQVIDQSHVLVQVEDVTIMIEGTDTSTIADGTQFQFTKAIHVTRTEQYKTVLGALRTVYVVEAVSDSQFDEIKRECIKRAPEGFDYFKREWTDVTGKFKIKAKLVKSNQKEITLKKEDGKEVTVPRSKMSSADRKWLIAEGY
jgi:SLA1 homology domain 1, SHD1